MSLKITREWFCDVCKRAAVLPEVTTVNSGELEPTSWWPGYQFVVHGCPYQLCSECGVGLQNALVKVAREHAAADLPAEQRLGTAT